MSTRQERINRYVDTNGKHPGWALLTAAVFGPLGYCYVRPGVGAILTLICGVVAWLTFVSLFLPVQIPPIFGLGVIGAIWLSCAWMAPFDAGQVNDALRAHAELIAAFDPRED